MASGTSSISTCVSVETTFAAETHELMQEVHDAMCAALAEIRNKK